MNTRDVVSGHISEQDDSYAWLIADQKMADESTVVEKYHSKGYMKKCETLAELAELIGCEESTLEETFSKWQAAVAAQNDTEFEHEAITSVVTDLSHAPYYAVQIAPGIHHCMGGVKINKEAEVIDVDGAVIENLFAAGEVTGGVHGGNRLGGNAVADFVVFGRIAGENAAK